MVNIVVQTHFIEFSHGHGIHTLFICFFWLLLSYVCSSQPRLNIRIVMHTLQPVLQFHQYPRMQHQRHILGQPPDRQTKPQLQHLLHSLHQLQRMIRKLYTCMSRWPVHRPLHCSAEIQPHSLVLARQRAKWTGMSHCCTRGQKDKPIHLKL